MIDAGWAAGEENWFPNWLVLLGVAQVGPGLDRHGRVVMNPGRVRICRVCCCGDCSKMGCCFWKRWCVSLLLLVIRVSPHHVSGEMKLCTYMHSCATGYKTLRRCRSGGKIFRSHHRTSFDAFSKKWREYFYIEFAQWLLVSTSANSIKV